MNLREVCDTEQDHVSKQMSKEVKIYKLKAKPGKISHNSKIHSYKLNLSFFMGLYNIPSGDGHWE